MATPPTILKLPAESLSRLFARKRVALPGDYWHKAMQLIIQALMDIEVSQMIAASHYERRPSRRAYRNGYRDSIWQTAQGDIPIRIPKLRSGTYFPAFLEKPNTEKLLSDFIISAYIEDISFETLLDLLHDIGLQPEAHQVGDIHESLYDLIAECRRDIAPYERIELDVLPVQLENKERYLAIAVGTTVEGERELLAHDITQDADREFWHDFVRRLNRQGIHAVNYTAVNELFVVLRLTETTMPQMALAA